MNTNTQNITVERGVSELLKVVSFADNGQVLLSKGADLKAYDVARLAGSFLASSDGMRDKTCGLLSLAESMDAVSVDTGSKNGDSPILKLVKAQDYVISLLVKDSTVSPGLLREAISLLPKYKIALANGWKPSAYYDAQSVLLKIGTVNDKGLIIAPSATEPLKLEAFNAVKKALDDKLPTSNGLRPIIEAEKAKVNTAHPGTFPTRGAKSKVAAALVAAATAPAIVSKVEIVHDAKAVGESLTRSLAEMTVSGVQCQKAMEAFKGDAKQKRASLFTPENWEIVQKIAEIAKSLEAMIRPLK